MAWVEAVSKRLAGGDKPRDIPDSAPDSDAYLWGVDIPVDIPEYYLRNIPCESCSTAVREAERVVRSRR